MPVEDSNFIFGKLGKKVSTVDEIYNPINFDSDYIYGIFDKSDIFSKEYLFAIQPKGGKIILLRYK